MNSSEFNLTKRKRREIGIMPGFDPRHKGDEYQRRIIYARQSRADVGLAILPAGGLSSPPSGLRGRLQPGLAAPRSVFNRVAMALRATKGDEDLRWWGGRPRRTPRSGCRARGLGAILGTRPTNCVFNRADRARESVSACRRALVDGQARPHHLQLLL